MRCTAPACAAARRASLRMPQHPPRPELFASSLLGRLVVQVWGVAVALYLVGTVVWNLFATGERVFD